MKLLHFLSHKWSLWSEPKWLGYRSSGQWQERKCEDCGLLQISQPEEK